MKDAKEPSFLAQARRRPNKTLSLERLGVSTQCHRWRRWRLCYARALYSVLWRPD